MEPCTIVRGVAVPMPEANIDTNQLCPTRFISLPKGPAYQRVLFHDQRFDAGDNEISEFILNRRRYRQAKIIVAGPNFGCGSSREMAVFALAAFGVRCVIASGMGETFVNNCFRNGVLPVILPEGYVGSIFEELSRQVGSEMTVNLVDQFIICPSKRLIPFDIAALRKRCLIAGLDEIGLTDQFADDVNAFEASHRKKFPWVIPADI